MLKLDTPSSCPLFADTWSVNLRLISRPKVLRQLDAVTRSLFFKMGETEGISRDLRKVDHLSGVLWILIPFSITSSKPKQPGPRRGLEPGRPTLIYLNMLIFETIVSWRTLRLSTGNNSLQKFLRLLWSRSNFETTPQ